ncbi:MAG: DUF2314 domain-containing protein [Pirellulaceae bacterium]|nr:DUF2314 domain-containing protein [Pirellulaceae bacterium]
MPSSPIFYADNSDPEMQRAYESARQTFRYFWRELSWERRRIVPALDMSAVKVPFTDATSGSRSLGDSDVEHMWLSEVDFDGVSIRGTLLNDPHALTSVSQGDEVAVALPNISDWMYSIGGEAYGGFSVNLLRSRMDRRERQQHDNAWGLNFGDPARVRIVPEPKPAGGFLQSLFAKPTPPAQPPDEHPMSAAMAGKLQEQLATNPGLVSMKDDRGWTFLHTEALAGNLATVQVLLAAGANPRERTPHGLLPRDLALSLGWNQVAAILPAR